jgi:hypothetical protein
MPQWYDRLTASPKIEPAVVHYEVTGVLVNGKRFKPIITTSLDHALSINLYRGTVWEFREDGTRKIITRVWN